MKQYLKLMIPLALVWAWTVSGCGEGNQLNTFPMERTSDILIPKGIGPGVPYEILTDELDSGFDDELASRGLTADQVNDVYLNYLGLEILAPTNATFGVVERVDVFLIAENLPEVQVAFAESILDPFARFIVLTRTQASVNAHFRSGKYQLKVVITPNEFVLLDMDVRVYQTFLGVQDEG